jgi:hypothetical protein
MSRLYGNTATMMRLKAIRTRLLLRWLNENRARHVPLAYSHVASLQVGIGLPHYQSGKSAHDSNRQILTADCHGQTRASCLFICRVIVVPTFIKSPKILRGGPLFVESKTNSFCMTGLPMFVAHFSVIDLVLTSDHGYFLRKKKPH